jgi:site-specific recombinase XerD
LNIKRSILVSFARWTRQEQIPPANVAESHVVAFVERSPKRAKGQVRQELAALRPFLRYVWDEAGVPAHAVRVDCSPAEELQKRYVEYLRNERGLAENSIRVYSPYISDFLSELMSRSDHASLGALDASTIQDFLLNRIQGRSSEYSRLLATALRSFLRFLFLRAEVPIDLSPSVPMVRKWRQSSVPTFILPEEVEHVLSATDRSVPGGLRDYAILLLLARLGLRAGEVVALELADIHWRTGEIVIRGKGRIADRLPLLVEIGEALALYLRTGRGQSASQRVFLRICAPRTGLASHRAVTHVVRRALARAAVQTPSGIAAHLFRHSLATSMIRNGASMAEISQLLRHRSQNSTEVYTKVAFESLRGVARPWPVAGGGR